MLLKLRVLYADIMSINTCRTLSKMRRYFVEKIADKKLQVMTSTEVAFIKSDDKLSGHMSIELSNLIDYFLGNTEENRLSAVAASHRKR